MCVVGIDEAGRGPWAGPISFAAVCIKNNTEATQVIKDKLKTKNSFKDSKKLSEKKREEIYREIISNDDIVFSHLFVSAEQIDKSGLKKVLDTAPKNLLCNLKTNLKSAKIILDGSLKLPSDFNFLSENKADEKYFEVALASIIAKVRRDKYMKNLSEKYPQYGFGSNKGYGTKKQF